MGKSKDLDQFFTKEDVSDFCVGKLKDLGLTDEVKLFIEPSSGSGSFVKSLKKAIPDSTIIYCDVDTSFYPGTLKKDFLTEDLELPVERSETLVLGNPPFGRRGIKAVEFINRSFQYSDKAAFILPLTFRKFLTQKLIDRDAILLEDIDLPQSIFSFNGKDYPVRCCFQIWLKNHGDSFKDLRLKSSPPIRHDDFDSWIYNATESTVKNFDNSWDFAVLRQGWGDFNPRMRVDSPDLSLRRQWILIHPKSPAAERILLSIDYDALASKNTSVKGFGKADLVEEYVRLKAEDSL